MNLFRVGSRNPNTKKLSNLALRSMSSNAGSASDLKFETLSVTNPKPFVYHVELNRPNKRNAMIHQMWLELKSCFEALSDDSNCRSVLLSGAGPMFCSGIDLQNFMTISQQMAEVDDVARKCKIMLKYIRLYQDSLSSIEKCTKPVISAVHNACIGAAVHMICAADIRYCTSDAWFQIREVDLGIAADVGALQRLPKIIGNASLTRELILTGRKFDCKEADKCGFVNRVFESQNEMMEEAMKVAVTIASKSPVAVQTAKQSLLYSQDHTIAEGLEHIALLNQTMLQSEDLMVALMAIVNKDSEPPVFSKL